ncbi:AraC family transcriptional regulator [Rubrobacter taiwanensis]|jgi:AraC family transcriptional regulator|uniref:AraC family transcriptional regulator n=1 Tax=Rubrobacter taiwanensis TaxID=185139 RepID=A0A4R1BG89_9ACTN|nr:AraC family transcriptional regulator [Rubrobacter taiwanensis]TCJ16154.1 AraC family transcriptional regulator [Rubrobacter taiwanensis]
MRDGEKGSSEEYLALHSPAVERVIAAMRRNEAGALSLRTMGEMAHLSPYHFARTFRKVTGVAPGEFLTAVRLERAKKLLLSTDLSVAEVCFEVGYGSLGTFTTRFRELVGLTPGRMRRLPEELHEALARTGGRTRGMSPERPGPGVAFRVRGCGLAGTLIFAGLFPSALPQGRPVAGEILEAPGDYRLAPVPDGRYHLMAAALPCSGGPSSLLFPGDALRVGRAPATVEVRGGRAAGRIEVELRPPRSTDPPVLIALPALLLERLAAR